MAGNGAHGRVAVERLSGIRLSPAQDEGSFRPERPRQQRLDRRVDAELAVEHRRDRGRDRHLDALLVRKLDQRAGGERAFGELALRRAAFAERDAEREVARLRRRAGEDEVAEPGQAGERLAARAEPRPKRASSAKPRVVSAAVALAPSLRPCTMPAAIASTFFAAPPISTPRTSVV